MCLPKAPTGMRGVFGDGPLKRKFKCRKKVRLQLYFIAVSIHIFDMLGVMDMNPWDGSRVDPLRLAIAHLTLPLKKDLCRGYTNSTLSGGGLHLRIVITYGKKQARTWHGVCVWKG